MYDYFFHESPPGYGGMQVGRLDRLLPEYLSEVVASFWIPDDADACDIFPVFGTFQPFLTSLQRAIEVSFIIRDIFRSGSIWEGF